MTADCGTGKREPSGVIDIETLAMLERFRHGLEKIIDDTRKDLRQAVTDAEARVTNLTNAAESRTLAAVDRMERMVSTLNERVQANRELVRVHGEQLERGAARFHEMHEQIADVKRAAPGTGQKCLSHDDMVRVHGERLDTVEVYVDKQKGATKAVQHGEQSRRGTIGLWLSGAAVALTLILGLGGLQLQARSVQAAEKAARSAAAAVQQVAGQAQPGGGTP